MERIKKLGLALVVYTLGLGACALLAPGAGNTAPPNNPPGKDVRVVNTASEPVPVIGTVQIGNTAANAARVLDVTNPAAQPYHSRVIVSLGPGEFVDDEDLEPVPPGKRLVLEYASVNAQLPIGQRLVVSVLAVNAGLSIPVVFQGTFQNTADLFVGSEPVRFYLNGGETPRVSAARSENGGNGSVQVNVSGHLVDL